MGNDVEDSAMMVHLQEKHGNMHNTLKNDILA